MGLGKGRADGEALSLLGKGTEVIGDISFTSSMRVDGVIKGKVCSEATLIIGASGLIDAEVRIRNITINGEFRGIIRASERVEIHKEGKVFGDIFSPCLIIEAGATFEGRCNMSETDIQKQAGDADDTDSNGASQSAQNK